MAEHTPFLTVFPGCTDLSDLAGGLEQASVTDVRVYMAERRLHIAAHFAAMPSPVEEQQLIERLQSDYALNEVTLDADYPQP